MQSRKLHKLIGLLLVLPILGWVITGLIFFIKPGYTAAYDQLVIKTYPLAHSFVIPRRQGWEDVRIVRTILGYHLLVKTAESFLHLDPISYQPQKIASNTALHTLLDDAFLNYPTRYGTVVSSDGYSAQTTTGVEVKLNWNQLTLSQSGPDTKLIDTLYKIHYLQWTPFKAVNQVLGFIGLLLLVSLTLLGIKIYISSKQKSRRNP